MTKDFDNTNWKQEILGSLEFNQSKFASKLVKNGPKSFMQSIYLGYIYIRWKKLKGYDKFDPKKNRAIAIIIKRVLEANQMKIIVKVRYVDS